MWGRQRNKYGAKAVKTPEGRFDSRGELGRWRELQLLQEGGAISGLKRQVRYPLKVNRKHIAFIIPDFTYTENGRKVVEDFKSTATAKLPAFRIKRDLFCALNPDIEFRISQRRSH